MADTMRRLFLPGCHIVRIGYRNRTTLAEAWLGLSVIAELLVDSSLQPFGRDTVRWLAELFQAQRFTQRQTERLCRSPLGVAKDARERFAEIVHRIVKVRRIIQLVGEGVYRPTWR